MSALVTFPFLLENWAGSANWTHDGWVGDGHIPWTQNQDTVMPVHSGTTAPPTSLLTILAPLTDALLHFQSPPFQAFERLSFFFRYQRWNPGPWKCRPSPRPLRSSLCLPLPGPHLACLLHSALPEEASLLIWKTPRSFCLWAPADLSLCLELDCERYERELSGLSL